MPPPPPDQMQMPAAPPLHYLLLASSLFLVSACTSYEVLNVPNAQDGIRYVRRETTFLFFVTGEDILRCVETPRRDTHCVTLAFIESDETPQERMPCSSAFCGRLPEGNNPQVSPPDDTDGRHSPSLSEAGLSEGQIPQDAIRLGGEPLFALPASTTTRLRKLVGQTIVLRTVYGKQLTGRLLEVQPDKGLILSRDQGPAQYSWNEVLALWAEER